MTVVRRWGVRVATGLAVVAVLASGCSEPQQASETLPSAAETSESPALEPLGPPDFPMPDEAREQTEAGAIAFTRYYLELYNHATANLDSSHLRELSQGCETCDNLAQGIEDTAAEGLRYDGGQVRVDWISNAALRGATAELAFSITEAPLSIVTSDGMVVPGRQYEESASPNCGAIVAWSATKSSWLFSQLDVA
jgi:hypothetical protein